MTEPAQPVRVVRLCSVFEVPADVPAGAVAGFDPIGGMQTHTGALTRALDSRGVEQRVVTTRPPGAPRRHLVGDRAVVHRVGLPVRRFRQLYGTPAAALVGTLARDASLLHAHVGEDLAVVPVALAAARRHRVPFVLTVHSSGADIDGQGLRGAALRHLGARLEAVGARHADAVIALTRRRALLLRRDGVDARRLHVIPSGVVPAGARPAGDDPLASVPRPRVLFVGRLAHQKGVRHLVEAAARMRTADAHVCLVGDGAQRPSLERLVARLALGARVHFLGFRPHGEIDGLMRAADVLVLPSLYEELGSVLLEAMQAGLPIVATRTGGIPEAVGDAALLVPPRDPPALAAALDALLADRGRRARLSALARERAGGYRWDGLADRVLEVYRQVLAEPGRR